MTSPLRSGLFLTIILAINTGLHYYIWSRLVRAPAFPSPWHQVASWALAIAAASVPLGLILQRFVPRPVFSPIGWVIYTWLGLVFFLFVLLLVTDTGRAVTALVRKLVDMPADPARREFLTRLVGATV